MNTHASTPSSSNKATRFKFVLLVTPFLYAVSEATSASPIMQIGAFFIVVMGAEAVLSLRGREAGKEVSPA